MGQIQDWFSGEQGLALWAIERRVILEILPRSAGEVVLHFGPEPPGRGLSQALRFDCQWQYDPARGADNPWRSDPGGNLPLQDDAVDLVILRHCLYRDIEARQLLSEMFRILKPGGHIVLACLNVHGWLGLVARQGGRQRLPGLSSAWLTATCRDTGFAIEQIRSHGLGGLAGRFADRELPGMMAAVGNFHVFCLHKKHDGGVINRVVYRLPDRGRAATANSGIYTKTGT